MAIGIEQALDQARSLRRSGDTAGADALAGEIARIAAARIASGQAPAAEALLAAVREITPLNPDALLYSGVCRQTAGEFAEAEELIRRSLMLVPGRADAWTNLGAVQIAQGKTVPAIESFRKAIAINPKAELALNNLGVALIKLRRDEEAESVLRAALALRCEFNVAAANLALVVTRRGRAAEGLALCDEILAADPAHMDALAVRADALARLGRAEEGIATLRSALNIRPGEVTILNNLGNQLQENGRVTEAIAVYRRGLKQAGRSASVWSNLGNALTRLGQFGEAVYAYRIALECDPDMALAYSNLIVALGYQPDVSGRDLVREACAWNERFGGRLTRRFFLNERDADKRLRVGYLSGDFRRHAAGYFIEPLIVGHVMAKEGRAAIDVFCYHDHPLGDEVTARLRAAVGEGWREAHGLSDEELAARIAADGIDVLVECSGHTAGSRLAMVAGRVAPVQATTLLGHGGTTGVAAVDYILADEVLVPPGSEGDFSEDVVRIEGVFAPFRPDPGWPEVAAEQEGPVRFGCFADPARIGAELVAAWGRILAAVPGARLLLKHRSYEDAEMALYWRERFKGLGERVELEGIEGGWGRHMGVYERVSVMLDTYPVTGASSTLIPLWMGVPVVTRAGRRVAERFGAALLTAAGLTELVAADGKGYEAIAVGLGRDAARRRSLRAGMRARLAASTLCDADAQARAHERAYRAMWRTWCRQPRDR